MPEARAGAQKATLQTLQRAAAAMVALPLLLVGSLELAEDRLVWAELCASELVQYIKSTGYSYQAMRSASHWP